MMTLEMYLKEHYSEQSIKGYKRIIRRFTDLMGEQVLDANYSDVVSYIGVLRKQGLHPKTLRNHLSAIKIYYRYLQTTEQRKDHPCQHLNLKDSINRQIAIEQLYSKKKLIEFYENYQSKKTKNQGRNKVIISLLIYQALTVLEIVQLKRGDINLEKGIIKIKGNIKNKGRVLTLHSNQILLVHNYIQKDWKGRKEEDYFITNQKGGQLWVGAISRNINQGRTKHKRFLPQRIRQSIIADMLRRNKDVRLVQAFAGHRRTGSTEAYKQTGLEELKAAIEKKHPLQ